MEQVSPTEDDIRTLKLALDMESRFKAGIFPRDGAQYSHFRKLERFGMIAFEDFGRDLDGEVARDVPCYRLTEQGRLWITQHEATKAAHPIGQF